MKILLMINIVGLQLLQAQGTNQSEIEEYLYKFQIGIKIPPKELVWFKECNKSSYEKDTNTVKIWKLLSTQIMKDLGKDYKIVGIKKVFEESINEKGELVSERCAFLVSFLNRTKTHSGPYKFVVYLYRPDGQLLMRQ